MKESLVALEKMKKEGDFSFEFDLGCDIFVL